jgi:pimeloyl-ACP methyl ester carboxylesterase
VQPRLIPTHVPTSPEGVVLVLHGGAARPERVAVSPTQLSVVRMIPVARRIARAGGARLATYRLLNSTRGWDREHTPVDDVAWALGELASVHGDLPVSLVGHSLGGRAALVAGELPPVTSIVALNPWLYPTDNAALAGRRVLFVHGDPDRIASISRAAAVARRLARVTDVGFITVPGGKHAMLAQGRVFENAAADFVVATQLGTAVGPPVERVLGGEDWITA